VTSVKTGKDCFKATGRLRAALLTSSALALAWSLPSAPAHAQDATWLASPGSNDYYTGSNWSTGTVPTGTVTFGASSQTNLTFSNNPATIVTAGAWAFIAGAPAYTFTNANTLRFTGGGITLRGAGVTINNTGTLAFDNSFSGGATINNSGHVYARYTSMAGDITNNSGGTVEFQWGAAASGTNVNNGLMSFLDSTAAYATITNNKNLFFTGSSSGGQANLINSVGANLNFSNTSTASSATIVNAGNMFFTNLTSAELANITNSGTLAFQDASSGSSALITNSANLNFSDGSSAGAASVITNNAGAYLMFNNSASGGSATILNDGDLIFNGTSSASSALITNNGRIYFRDNSTAGNAALINPGSVDFSPSAGPNNDHKLNAGSIAGAGLFFLGANELTVGSNNQSTAVSGVIADGGSAGGTGGSLVKVGTGVLTLSANNSYTGGTTITAGTLQLGDGGTTGSILGNIVDNGTLAFNRSDTITVAIDISGTGDMQKLGSNTMILTGANSFTGTTTIAGGTLQIGNGGTTGSLVSNVVDNGVLTINRSDTITLGGDISGSGSLQQVGSGTTILTGTNSYTGGTTITAGTLQLGSGGTTGSIVGNVANEGTLAFNRSDTLALAANISGSGSVRQIGSGTTILAGANTYSGDTTISAGRLQFGDGSVSGRTNLAGNVNVTGGTLAIQAPASLNVAQTVTLGNNTALAIVAGTNSPALSANTVAIGSGVGFNVSGINDASQLDKVLIDTRSGISGDFANITIGGFSGTVDYLTMNVRKSTDGLQYLASYGLSWTAGNSSATGTFTLTNASDSFTLGTALTDQAANPANGWNGTSLTKAGAGTLILTGQNSYSGGTTISGGTLQIGSGGVTGSIRGAVAVGSGATFEVVNADTSGITGINNAGTTNFRNSNSAGSASVSNGGTLSFYDTSTAGTASIDNSGTLSFLDHSSAGLASINNHTGQTLRFNVSSTAGSATITNDGALFFNNSGSAGHATITNDYTVYFNDSGTAANATITNNVGGSIRFDDLSTAGHASIGNSGTIYFFNNGKAGSATITNDAVIEFMADSTAENAVIVNNGNHLWFTQNASAGNATVTNAGTGTLEFHDASTAGGASINNNGQMTLIDRATAGYATITNNAQLTFRDSATAGNATVTNTSQLTFYGNSSAGSATIHNSGNVLFDRNSTAGNAQLVNVTSGAVIDFFTPGPNRDGKINAGSIAGNGRFNLYGAELTVGGNNLSTNVTGVLTGDGSLTGTSLVKAGTGTLTLAGINTYTGATRIDGGILAVNGSIASSSSLIVNTGGTLGGTGTVGNTTIVNGGTLAPGNSVGTLSVSGNLAFSTGSFYRVEVSTTASDRTNVSGTATLTGATVQAVAIPGSFRSQTYTILNATGGLGGTKFAGLSVSGSFSPTRNPHLTYDLNNVYLVLDPGMIILPPGSSGNQTGVAGGINNAVESGATPPAGFDTLLNMSGAQLARALGQVSGQPGAASTQAAFNAMDQFLGMLDPLGGGTDGERGAGAGAMSYAAAAPDDARVREAYAAVTPPKTSGKTGGETSGETIDRRWGVWASAYGGGSNLSGNAAAGSSSTTSRIYGTVVGADYRVSPNTVVGFALGGAGYNFALSDSLGGGRADLFQAGFYGRHTFGPAYLAAALAYGWQDVTTDRTVTVAGTDKLTANFKASTFSGRLEAGWRFAPIPASSFGVTPYAAAQVTTFHLPGYGETAIVGSNQFALSYNSQDTTNVRTELGARTDQRFLVNDGALTLRGRLAWAHDSNTSRLVSAAFQTLPGAAFTVSGARPAADSALVGGRAEIQWRNGLSLAGTVEGEFSPSTQTYTGKGTVRYEW